MKLLYLLVEGEDDKRFLEAYYHSKCRDLAIRVVKYASWTPKDIANLIRSFSSFRDADYLFFADADGATIESKIDIVKRKHPYCEKSKIRIVQQEIESWYIAGWSENMCAKYKVKYISHTDDLSKEKFNSMIPRGFTHISFQVEILKRYDVELAKSRNVSFRNFTET